MMAVKEEDTQEEGQERGASAETEKTGGREGFIPRDRFDEVNKRARELEAENERLKAERKAETDKRLAEQEKWEELATQRGEELAEVRARAEKVDAYEKTLQNVLDAQVEQVPEELRALIPQQLSTQQKLEWLAQNKSLLIKPKPFNIGAGKRGGDEKKSVELTQEEREYARKLDIPEVEYAKYK